MTRIDTAVRAPTVQATLAENWSRLENRDARQRAETIDNALPSGAPG